MTILCFPMLSDGKKTTVAFLLPRLRPLVRLIKVMLVWSEKEALGNGTGVFGYKSLLVSYFHHKIHMKWTGTKPVSLW